VYAGPGSDYDNQFCGGALIDAWWVVTTAHCIFDEFGELTTDDFAIIVGRTNLLGNDGETLTPMSIFIHEDYDNDLDGGIDVALIKLATPSSGNPVTLARNPDARYLAPGHVAIATGRGGTAGYAPGIEDPPVAFLPALQEVDEPLRADSDCAERYGPIYDNATMVCAGGTAEGGSGSCQSDSGGPLVVFDELSRSWILAGITGFGDGCAAAVPAVYIEVAGVLSFIEGHTGPLLPETTPQAYLPLLTKG
jgi:secreted trypsin-like serine protease